MKNTIRLTILWLCLGAAAGAAAQQSPAEIPIGGTLQDATLRGLNGPPRKLSDLFFIEVLVKFLD
jgi:hypothetical protein